MLWDFIIIYKVTSAPLLSLHIVVLRINEMLAAQRHGQGHGAGLREALALRRVPVRRVDGSGFVRPEQVNGVVGFFF